jgi:hypothetical protein
MARVSARWRLAEGRARLGVNRARQRDHRRRTGRRQSDGAVTVSHGPHFWAAPFEIGDEFGGLGLPHPMPADAAIPRTKRKEFARAGANTTIAVIATDAKLSKAAAKRLAIAAHDGFFPRHLADAHAGRRRSRLFACHRAQQCQARRRKLDRLLRLPPASPWRAQ